MTRHFLKRFHFVLLAAGAIPLGGGGCGRGAGGELCPCKTAPRPTLCSGTTKGAAETAPLTEVDRKVSRGGEAMGDLEAMERAALGRPDSKSDQGSPGGAAEFPAPVVVRGARCPASGRSPYSQPFANPARNSLADARYCRGVLKPIEVRIDALGSGSADWLYTTNSPLQVVVASKGRALRVELKGETSAVSAEDLGDGTFPLVLLNGKIVGASGQLRGLLRESGAALALTEEPGAGANTGGQWAALRKIPYPQLHRQRFQRGMEQVPSDDTSMVGWADAGGDSQSPAIAQWKLDRPESVRGPDGRSSSEKNPPGKLLSSSPFLANREVVVNHGDLLRWMRPTGKDVAVFSEAVIPGSAVADEQNTIVAFAEGSDGYDLLWVNLAARKTDRTRLPDVGAPVQPPVVLPNRIAVVFEDRVVSLSGRSLAWTAPLDPTRTKGSLASGGSGRRANLEGSGTGDWEFPQTGAPMATATRDGRLVIRFKNYLSVIGPNGEIERAIEFPSPVTSNPIVLSNGGICACTSSLLKCALPTQ